MNEQGKALMNSFVQSIINGIGMAIGAVVVVAAAMYLFAFKGFC